MAAKKRKEEPSHRASIMVPADLWKWLGDRARLLGHSGRSNLIRSIMIAYRERATEPETATATRGGER